MPRNKKNTSCVFSNLKNADTQNFPTLTVSIESSQALPSGENVDLDKVKWGPLRAIAQLIAEAMTTFDVGENRQFVAHCILVQKDEEIRVGYGICPDDSKTELSSAKIKTISTIVAEQITGKEVFTKLQPHLYAEFSEDELEKFDAILSSYFEANGDTTISDEIRISTGDGWIPTKGKVRPKPCSPKKSEQKTLDGFIDGFRASTKTLWLVDADGKKHPEIAIPTDSQFSKIRMHATTCDWVSAKTVITFGADDKPTHALLGDLIIQGSASNLYGIVSTDACNDEHTTQAEECSSPERSDVGSSREPEPSPWTTSSSDSTSDVRQRSRAGKG